MQTVTEPVRKKIYETKIAPYNAFMNQSVGLARVRKGLFAFNMELMLGYKLIQDTFYEHEKCGLIEIQYLQLSTIWMVTQKRSPYKEIFKTK